jgi:hypothetical protein
MVWFTLLSDDKLVHVEMNVGIKNSATLSVHGVHISQTTVFFVSERKNTIGVDIEKEETGQGIGREECLN